MPKATVQIITRSLHNLALPALVDEFGTVKAQIAELERCRQGIVTTVAVKPRPVSVQLAA